MSARYPPSSYDDSLCLKPPLLLWIAVLYLSRAVAVPVVAGMGALAGGGADTWSLIRGLFSPSTLVASLAAALVLLALMRRTPSASRPIRWIWAHGRLILTASALLDIAVFLAGWALHGDDPDAGSGTRLIAAALDAYFLAYIAGARRVRDTFAEFPPAIEAEAK